MDPRLVGEWTPVAIHGPNIMLVDSYKYILEFA